MIYSLTGSITALQPKFLVIELSGIGYQVFITRPELYQLQQVTTIFIYEVIKEDDHYLVGFPTLLEKDMFTQLLSVKGIGPKTALAALAGGTPNQLIEAINGGNLSFLKSLPGIGNKAASQIILDLKGKLVFGQEDGPRSYAFEEAKEALKTLGFKSSEIDDVLKHIPSDTTHTETIMKLALKKLGR